MVLVCRLILENLLKYGLRMNFFKYIAASLSGRGNLPLVLAFPALLLLSLASLGIELLAWRFVHAEEQVGSDNSCLGMCLVCFACCCVHKQSAATLAYMLLPCTHILLMGITT
jgi:hypothetical protein